jgi:hypothetical protein
MSTERFRVRVAKMSDEELQALQSDTGLTAEERQVASDEVRAREEGALAGTDAAPISVVIRDFDMPFWNVVVFTVKLVVASLPALILLLGATILIGGLLVGFLREFR